MENIKEKLTAEIERIIDNHTDGLGNRPMAEAIVVLLTDFVKQNAPGPTGEFPDGKVDANDDEGGTKMLISENAGNVRIDFGQPLAWFAMPKPQALTFAFTVLERCGIKIEHKIQQDPAPGAPA